ncbi:Txe/YoeB family addiction module toxin [Dyadobacter sp. CY323]|uniref:Txe/YoeB family addiction module toxin n=1 Tax=Dyadobacter sp. CY323 TaxID=2907302 RepID=UPI001F295610|nr:Txe/YoeB family addiction module toxin [Dyadobacter sp. CY323]MCE6988465.1 Txe/YoeB family addiction module toxin [Dyadobacter sp. CY323]
MEIELTTDALEDLKYWKKTGNNKILKRIKQLLANIEVTPFDGIGKPEPLKENLSGKWSRRIDREHRIIYTISSQKIIIYSLKGHYN